MTENNEGTYVDEVTGRQRWNTEYYAAKAAGVVDLPTPLPPTIERKTLQRRKKKVNLEKDVGSFKFITSQTSQEEQGGFWCSTCKCLMKDSQSYLDHINGKKHNRQLGMIMRVERIDNADLIRQRLRKIRIHRLEQEEKKNQVTDIDGVKIKLKKLLESERDKKLLKKQKKKQKKKEKQESLDNEVEYVTQDPNAIFAIMNQETVDVNCCVLNSVSSNPQEESLQSEPLKAEQLQAEPLQGELILA